MTLVRVQLNTEVTNGPGAHGRLRIVAATVVTGLALAACGSSASSSPGTSAGTTAASATAASPAPSATSAVCQAAADLRASVTALAHVKVGQGTVDEVKSDLANVQAKLTALTAELHDSYKTQTSAVQSALNALKTAVSELSAHPSASTLQGVATAIGGVTTAVGSLVTSLAPQCEAASATPSP